MNENIAAHDFIPEDYWADHYDEVSQMMMEASVYVYEEDSIKGFIGLTENYIAGIFVESNSQAKGIGQALLSHVKEIYNELFLHVYQKNEKAIKFYLREGFTIENEQIDLNTGEKELTMQWVHEEKIN